MRLLLFIICLCYLPLLVVGTVLWLRPPQQINAVYGYRTPLSVKSQANWEYANQVSAKALLVSCHVALLLALAVSYFGKSLSVVARVMLITTLFVVSALATIPFTEHRLALYEKTQSHENS